MWYQYLKYQSSLDPKCSNQNLLREHNILSVCSVSRLIYWLTLISLHFSFTAFVSSFTSYMRRYSPDVAIRSWWFPSFKHEFWLKAYQIGNPHNFSGRVFMLESATLLEVSLHIFIKSDYFDFVLCVLDEWTQREPDILFRLIAEVDCIEREVRLIGVDLFPLSWSCILLVHALLQHLLLRHILIVSLSDIDKGNRTLARTSFVNFEYFPLEIAAIILYNTYS